MRLRTCNSRRKRLLLGRQKVPKGKPFCYIVYGKRITLPVYNSAFVVVNYEVHWREWKRPFDNYAEAIAHLTRVKLAIDEESRYWKHATPCKIVEGVYAKSGKEIITKEVRLNNECDRPPERHFSSGLPRQQRRRFVPANKIVGTPYQTKAAGGGYYTNPYVDTGALRGSGTTTSSSPIASLESVRDECQRLSDELGWYSATTN